MSHRLSHPRSNSTTPPVAPVCPALTRYSQTGQTKYGDKINPEGQPTQKWLAKIKNTLKYSTGTSNRYVPEGDASRTEHLQYSPCLQYNYGLL